MKVREEQRLEALEDAIARLRMAAAGSLVVVEGRKDVAALDALGVGGEALTVHRGKTLEVLADDIVRQAGPRTVILLVDWDRTGGRLFRRLHDALAGRVTLDVDLRRRIARASYEKCLEDVPGELAALRRKAGRWSGSPVQ